MTADRTRRAVVTAGGLVLGYVLLTNVVLRVVFGSVPWAIHLDGAVIGLLYGMLAAGLILVYRANRIINFAQAQLGAVPAITGLLLIGSRGWNWFVVMPLVLVTAGGLGALVEVAFIRRFRDAPRLLLTVATIGVGLLLVALEGQARSWVVTHAFAVTSFRTPFTRFSTRIGPLVFTADALVAAVVAVGFAAGLGLFLRRTELGIGVRAAAENRDRAVLVGVPVNALSTLVWALSAVLSAAAIFLRGPLVGVTPGGSVGPSVLLFGLAAAVLAGMEKLPHAVVAGVAIGIVEQTVFFATGDSSLTSSVMVVVIIAALLVQRRSGSRARDSGVATWDLVREHRRIPVELRSLPEVVWARRGLWAAVVFSAVGLPLLLPERFAGRVSIVVIVAIIGVSLVVLTGWGGQISLGQFAFAGVGAAVAGGLAANHHTDFFVTLIAAGVAGAAAAVVIGLPALRMHGLFLAVTTLAFAFAVQGYVLDAKRFSWLLPKQGAFVERPILYGVFDIDTPTRFYFVCLTFLLLSMALARSLRRTRSGRVVIASRDNERAAQAYGINLARTRLSTFAISGFMAAVAGALLAYQSYAVDQATFAPARSISVFTVTVIGGLASVPGAVLGALYVEGLPLLFNSSDFVRQLTSSVGLLALLLVLPGGLADGLYQLRDRALRWVVERNNDSARIPDAPRVADPRRTVVSVVADALTDGVRSVARGMRNLPSTTARFLRDPSAVLGAAVAPIVVLYLHMLLDSLDGAGLGVVLPEIQKAFGLSLRGITALTGGTAAIALLVSLPVGFRADRGRRVLFLGWGALVAGVFGTAAALASVLWIFVITRVVFSLGLRVNDPVQQSLLTDYTPLDKRPGVFAGRQAARSIGQMLGPLFVGLVASLFDWRIAMAAVTAPAILVAIASFLIPEPARGGMERRERGLADDDTVVDDDPPSWSESFRILKSVATVRRLWFALPFLVGGTLGLASLLPLYLENAFGLSPGQRGVVTAIDEPFALVGLALAVPLAMKLLTSDRPERIFGLVGGFGIAIAIGIGGLAVAPNVPSMIVIRVATAMALAPIVPMIGTAFSMVLPPRVRTLGFSVAAVYALPGLAMLPIAGAIGDAYGFRWGMLVGAPVFAIGAAAIMSAGAGFRRDMAATVAAAAAMQEDTAARARGQGQLLATRGVEVSYGQVQILFGVDLDVGPGEVVALLGTNGAGKSTLLKAVSGLIDVERGTILYEGRDITHANGIETTKAGIVHVPGGRAVFPTLTVEENLRLACWLHHDDGERLADARRDVFETFPILHERRRQLAGDLSGGEQQQLGIAMAMLARPTLLIIDELSLGLAPATVEQLLTVVRRIRDSGVAVLLVEQSINVAMSLAERAYFLEKGEVRFAGPTAELLGRDDVARSVFLAGATTSNPAVPRRESVGRRGGPRLEVEGLVKAFGGRTAVDGVTFRVEADETLGIIGANGAGKTTVFDLVSGFLQPDTGAVRLDGVDITRMSPDTRAWLGLGRSFQDARLFASMTVAENLALALERHLLVRDYLASALGLPGIGRQELDVAWTVHDLVELMGLGDVRDKFVRELSTGTRRIVDLAMCVAHSPSVLLLDEPSSGIAQREAEALAPLLRQIRSEIGCSLLVIEHDMPVITAVSDRLVALDLGAVLTEGAPNEVLDDPRVQAAYLGGDVAAIQRSGARA